MFAKKEVHREKKEYGQQNQLMSLFKLKTRS